jgi:hypothetical protein
MPKYSDEELAFLSPEERAGALEEDDTGGAVTEMVDDDEKEELKADETQAADDETAEEREEPKAASAETPEPKAEPQPMPAAELPELPVGEVKDWAALRLEAKTKYEEGDLSREEYDEKLVAITLEQAEANFNARYNEGVQRAKWERDQQIFWDQNKDLANKAGLRAALDAHVSAIDNETGGKLDGFTLLTRAKAKLDAELGVEAPKADDPKPKTTARPLPKPGEAEKRAIDKAPKTLAEVPAADRHEETEDKFAHLDNLNGEEFEMAIARMSKADQDAFSRLTH